MQLKEHSVNSLDNFIGGWYISPELCDEIKEECIKKKENFFSVEKELPKGIRNYHYSSFNELNLNDLGKKYFKKLDMVLSEYKKKYPYCDDVQYYGMFRYKIQYYEPNDYYSKLHCENTGGNDKGKEKEVFRHLVFMTYLNDISEGGETEFHHQNIKIKPEKGLTLIWPTIWTHVHRGCHTPEEKFIITGWYEFFYK